MKTSALPRTSMTNVIATCRFVKPADKAPTRDADCGCGVGPWFTASTVGCCLAASSCYVMCSFPSKQIK